VVIAIALFGIFVTNVNAQLDPAWNYLFSNKYNLAIKVFKQALDKGESNEYIYGLAISYMRYAQFNDTLYKQMLLHESLYYKELNSMKGTDIKNSKYVPYYFGVNQLNLGQYDNAITNLNLIKNNKYVEDIYKGFADMAIAECYLKNGNTEKAKKIIEGVRSKVETDNILGSELASLYADNSMNIQEMASLYKKCVAKGNPENHTSRYWHNIAIAAYRSGSLQDAINYLSKADVTVPDFVDLVSEDKKIAFYIPTHFKYRAEIYFAQAASLFSKLNQQNEIRFDKPPFNQRINFKENVIYYLAKCYTEMNRYDDAIEALKKSNNAQSKVLLGFAYYKDNHKNLAESEWNKISSNSLDSKIELAYTYARLGINKNKVQQLLNSMKDTNLSKVKSLQWLTLDNTRLIGISYLNIRDYDNAIESFEKIHDKVAKNTVGAFGDEFSKSGFEKGNDPTLLLNLALTFYLKGYNYYTQPTETYLIMQRTYPELKQVHNIMQGIFAIWASLDSETKEILICEQYSLLFG
jgi:tetratricopeptide (TPR) repeat protein